MQLMASFLQSPFLTRVLVALPLAYFLNVAWQTDDFSARYVLVGALWLAGAWAISRRMAPTGIMILGGLACIAWALASGSVPFSDFDSFHKQANALAAGSLDALLDSKSPPTVAFYSIFAYLFGPSHLAHYLASAVAWCSGSWLIHGALRSFGADPGRARFVLTALVLFPPFILFSPVVSSEAVYYLLTAACLRILAGWKDQKATANAIGLGSALALLFLTRSTGIVLLVAVMPLVVYPRLAGQAASTTSGSVRLGGLAAVLLSFGLVIAAHGTLHWSDGRNFQLTGSPWGAYNLMAGTNVEHTGRWNIDDLVLAGYTGPNEVSDEEASANAARIAWQRIARDPLGMLRFSMTDKIRILWSQAYAYEWAVTGSENRSVPDVRYSSFALSTGRGAYVATTLLMILALCGALVRGKPHQLALAMLPVIGYAMLHVVVEVQGRYQLSASPFMVAVAAFYSHWWLSRLWGDPAR